MTRRKYVTEENRETDRERERERERGGRKGASGISRSFSSGTVRLDLNHSGNRISETVTRSFFFHQPAEIWLMPRNRSIPPGSEQSRADIAIRCRRDGLFLARESRFAMP